MSLATPLTSELSTNIVAQLEAELSQTIPLLPKAFIRVLAKVLAGVNIILYKYAGFSLLQMFISTATFEETEINGTMIRPLLEWGRQVGVGDPSDAVRAELVTRVTVLTQTGVLPSGTQLLRSETGVIYQTTTDTAIDAATLDVTIRASSDPGDNGGAGEIGNLEDGDTVDFVNPPSQVGGVTTIQSTTVSGADGETAEAYRARVLEHEQARPQGGAYADYRIWAQSATDVARAYPYTGSPGEVDVFIEATTNVDPDGIPNATVLQAAEDAINLDLDGLATRRSANSLVNTLPIFRTQFSVQLQDLTSPTLPATQQSISDGVDEFLRSREPFILGLSVLPRLDRITQGDIAGVVTEIVNADGGTVNDIVLVLGATASSGTPITSRTLGMGEKAKLGNVEFI